jgi:hypothetical protein
VQRVGSRICKETGFKDMPPNRIVAEPRFKKIFTRSDFLVCVRRMRVLLTSIAPSCFRCAPSVFLTFPPHLSSPGSYIERAKFQDVQFKDVTVKVAPLPPNHHPSCSPTLWLTSHRMLTTRQGLFSPMPRSTLWYALPPFSRAWTDALWLSVYWRSSWPP